MKTSILRLSVIFVFLVQCTHAPYSTTQFDPSTRAPSEALTQREPMQAGAPSAQLANLESNDSESESLINDQVVGQPTLGDDWLMSLPGDPAPYLNWMTREVSAKRYRLPDDQVPYYAGRLAKYLAFLMFRSQDSEAGKLKTANALVTRMLSGSTQFLFCPDLNDLVCLERIPRLTPTADFRREDPSLRLHEPVVVAEAFEFDKQKKSKVDFFFNQQIFIPEEEYNPKTGVALKLKNLIESVPAKPGNAIYMALYGIDDISTDRGLAGNKRGSLAPIYNALLGQKAKGLNIGGVFDHNGAHENVPKEEKLLFSYVTPQAGDDDKNEEPDWIFSPLKKPVVDKVSKRVMAGFTNMAFMYNGGTQGMITELNRGIDSESEARARLEWPNRGIMHNKFFIFQNGANKSLWTGTANISRTCLGTERNSNLSVHIRDNTISNIFKAEFDEMFTYIGANKQEIGDEPPDDVEQEQAKDKDRFVGYKGRTFPRGRFHMEKKPNTNRIVYYKGDDTTARIYFSPTDDGEHRALIPMLHQAEAGDRILISMFGAGGIEYVRAIQLASARGADVNIIVDSPTACGESQWADKSGPASLLTQSPFRGIYNRDVPFEMHRNVKKSGEIWKQNHQKIGLLLKSAGAPGKYITRHFAFGSQNWSVTGNDVSDENMMVLSRTKKNLKLATAFQVHFDQFLWPKSDKIASTGCKKLETADDDPEAAGAAVE